MTEESGDLAMEDATEESEDLAIEDGAEEGERTKGGRRRQNFQANAIQSLQRARKSASGDDEVTPRATLLVTSAVGWALLDLAEAVRSHGATDSPEA
jgi:hypothetical protein